MCELPESTKESVMQNGQILATVDLGSNSFRLQMARLESGQLVTID